MPPTRDKPSENRHERPDGQLITPPPEIDGRDPANTLRIVVVEDDALIAVLLGEMLTEMGHDVCAIESTEADAVLAAARCQPDLMIIDARLGEGSGIRAMSRILRVRPVPHVFTSGDILRVHAVRPNAVVIEKPYDEADLARGIGRAMAVLDAAAPGGSDAAQSAGAILP